MLNFSLVVIFIKNSDIQRSSNSHRFNAKINTYIRFITAYSLFLSFKFAFWIKSYTPIFQLGRFRKIKFALRILRLIATIWFCGWFATWCGWFWYNTNFLIRSWRRLRGKTRSRVYLAGFLICSRRRKWSNACLIFKRSLHRSLYQMKALTSKIAKWERSGLLFSKCLDIFFDFILLN